MCTFLLPKTVIKQIDKFRKHCIWRGSDLNNKNPSKTAWPLVCLPKPEGGLGVLDLKTQNESLLMKHLHKFFNKRSIPWVQLVWDHYYSRNNLPSSDRPLRGSFWWEDILKLLESFKEMTRINIQSGSTCFLWLDLWNQRIYHQSYPELFFPMLRPSTLLLKLQSPLSLLKISSIFLCPLKLLSNFRNFLILSRPFSLIRLMMFGPMFGVLLFTLLSRHTSILLVIDRSIDLSSGYEHLLVKTKERFSSG
jgi:hypothetical protein